MVRFKFQTNVLLTNWTIHFIFVLNDYYWIWYCQNNVLNHRSNGFSIVFSIWLNDLCRRMRQVKKLCCRLWFTFCDVNVPPRKCSICFRLFILPNNFVSVSYRKICWNILLQESRYENMTIVVCVLLA